MKLASSFRNSTILSMVCIWLSAAFPTQAANLQWTNTAGGNWSAALNWMPHQVPGPGDVARVTLTTASRLEVKLDVDATVAGLTLGGSAHNLRVNGKTLTVNGPISLDANQQILLDSGMLVGSDATTVSGGTILWSGGGITGPLSLDSTNTLQLRGVNGTSYDLQDGLTNAGTVQIVSGNLRARGGQLYNLPGGLVDFQSDSDLVNYNLGTETLSNQGTIRKSGGTGLTTIDVPCFNQGTIDAAQGTLDWSSGGSFDPGSSFSGTGTNQFSGGSFSMNTGVNIPHARLAGAILFGANGTIDGSWVWTAGTLGQTDTTLALAANGVLTLKGLNGTSYDLQGVLTNAGTIQLLSGNLRFRGGQLYNLPGALLNFQSDSDVVNYNNGTELLSNQGTVRKSGGTGLSTVDVLFDNQGSIDAAQGTLDWSNGGSLDFGSVFTGSGTNQFSGGTFAITTSVTIPNARLAGATLSGADGTLAGSWVWTSGSMGQPDGTLTLGVNGTLTLKGSSVGTYDLAGSFTNAGTFQILSGSLRCRDGQIYNLVGGVVNFLSDSDLANYNVGTELLNNLGTIRKSGGTGLSAVDVPFYNQGAIDAVQGTLDWSDGGSLGPGSTFSGVGTNQFSAGTFAVNTSVNLPNARLAGAILAGANATLHGSWIWTSGSLGVPDGTIALASDSVLMLKGSIGTRYDLAGSVTNFGTLQLVRGDLRCRDGQLYNQAGGLVDFQGDSGLANYNVGSELVSNLGTVRKSLGAGTNRVDLPFTNRGLIDVQLGAVALENTYDLTGGRLNCGLNGSGNNGQLVLSDAASLKGAFSANLNGYIPGTGDTFTVVRFGSRVGIFSGVALPDGFTWQTNYSSTAFTLKVTGSSVVPQFLVAIDLVAGLPHLAWTNKVGERFQTQYRDSLSSGSWTSLGPILVPTGTTTDITDSTAPGVASRLYRIQKLP